MRDYKFRAWDEDNKCMVEEIETSDIYINSSGNLIKHCALEIMQYTGLKDKNGKEIYEGDIEVGKITRERALDKDEAEWRREQSTYYGVPAYIGKDKELNNFYN